MADNRPASQTAYGPIVTVAVEQHFPADRRLVSDELAARMLPSGFRWTVACCRWAFLRRMLLSASEAKAPGIWAWMCGRKRYIDEQVERAIADGIDAVVVLGAGLDTCAARVVARHPGVRAFELDLPANVTVKEARLRSLFDRVPDGITLIPVDFEGADLAAELAQRGLGDHQRAIFVWEGVTQYLTAAAVDETLAFLSKAPSGSRLVFTYVRRDFIDGDDLHGANALHRDLVIERQVWQYGIDPSRVGALLQTHGWREVEQAGATEVMHRYVEPTGRALPVSEIERCVYAERI